ncbi:MAG: response regulator [Bacteroidales bacterium]
MVRLQLKKKEQYGYFRITMNSIKNEGVVSQVTGLMRDVSLQYKQQELEESRKQRLLLAVKGGNVRLWDYDVKSHILKLYGEDFAVTDLSQKDQTALINRIYEDDKKRSLEIFSVLQNGKDFSINLSLALNVSGATEYSRKYIMISGMPMKKDESGKVLFYTGIYKDETDSHLLINELKELNLTKKLILDNSNAGFAYIDKDFHILWENFSTMYKDSSIGSFFSKNAVGRTCFSAIRNLNVPCKDCYVVEAYKSRKMETKELTLAERTIEFTGIPCFDNGVYLGSVLRGVDITANKQHLKEIEDAQDSAEQARDLLKTVIERVPCALFMKDVDDDYRYTVVNGNFADRVGRPESEIVGKTDYDLFELEEADRFRSDDTAAVSLNKLQVVREQTVWKGERVVWQTFKSPIVDDDGHKSMIGIGIDVTELSDALVELKKAKDHAEQADILKSAFLANMSHEIRTPLNSIVGFSDLLIDTDDPKLRRDFGKIITNNSEVLLNLINDVLDFSKIEAGYIDFVNAPFDFTELCRDVEQAFSSKIPSTITFSLILPYDSFFVNLDKNRMMQVINNLISNAIKCTETGSITLKYEYVDGKLRIFVSDTGCGIPKEDGDKIFVRFEKLDSFKQGSGIGLSICKTIIERMGGTIDFTSEVGVGTIFMVEVPSEVVQREDQDTLSGSRSRRRQTLPDQVKKRHILVVEDNTSNYLLLRALMRNYDVERAENGVQAVEMAKKHPYAVIFMDLKMPEMDGIEATKRIRAFDKKTKIIAVSANVYAEDKQQAYDAGCNDFFCKPIRLNDVIKAIEGQS